MTSQDQDKINIFYYFARTVHGKVKQYVDIKSNMLMYKQRGYFKRELEPIGAAAADGPAHCHEL